MPAYFITWSTYATRLHGDERGSVDPRHNGYDTPLLPRSESRRSFEFSELKHPPTVLSVAQRTIVDRAIRAHVAFRAWTLHALSVRSNHVHLVAAADVEPETIMGQCKAWASRRLREAGLLPMSSTVWTRHGSTRYLFDSVGLTQAIDYVTRLQEHVGQFEEGSARARTCTREGA